MDDFAVAELETVGKAAAGPFGCIMKADPGVEEDDDFVSVLEELFGFAGSFGPTGTAPRDVAAHVADAVICGCGGEVFRFGADDLWMEILGNGLHVISVDCLEELFDGMCFGGHGWKSGVAKGATTPMGMPYNRGAMSVVERATGAPGQITSLFGSHENGDPCALPLVLEILWPELRRMAAAMLAGERGGHTLQPTALVNEMFLRMVDGDPQALENGKHFLCAAAAEMRRVLVDHARRHHAARRMSQLRVDMPAEMAAITANLDMALEVDRLLADIKLLSERAAQVVELRFFAGLTSEEAAAVLEVDRRTVDREWAWARRWMRARLAPEVSDER